MRTALVGSRMVNHLACGMVRENQSCAGPPLAPERSRWETVNPDTVKQMLVPRPNWDRESGVGKCLADPLLQSHPYDETYRSRACLMELRGRYENTYTRSLMLLLTRDLTRITFV